MTIRNGLGAYSSMYSYITERSPRLPTNKLGSCSWFIRVQGLGTPLL